MTWSAFEPMPAPPRSFLTVSDTAIRWQVPALDIAGWAIDGEIALSAVLPTVETADKQIASGIVEIDGADVVALFRRDGSSRKPALVRRFRRSKKSDWEWIARDLPLTFHPAAIRASAGFTPCGAGGATDDRRSWSGLRSRSPVAVKLAA
jgi:hypothetical protein